MINEFGKEKVERIDPGMTYPALPLLSSFSPSPPPFPIPFSLPILPSLSLRFLRIEKVIELKKSMASAAFRNTQGTLPVPGGKSSPLASTSKERVSKSAELPSVHHSVVSPMPSHVFRVRDLLFALRVSMLTLS